MSRIAGGAALAALASFPLLLAPQAADACSVCLAGDPVYSTQGATAQEPGSFSLYLEARGFHKSSGLLPHGGDGAADEPDHGAGDEPDHAADPGSNGEERSRGERLDLYASWTPLDRWTLTLDLPYAWNRIVEESDEGKSISTLSGLGDVSLGSSVVLWRNREVLPSTWIEGRLWLKAPTGRDESEVDGELDPHLQPGTGSWDFGGGLAAVHRLSWGSAYGSVFYRVNTKGALDYEHGDVLLANAALEVPLGHALGQPALGPFTAGLELNFRYAGYDLASGERYVDSGGSILYLTPSVRYRLPFGIGPRPASLRAAVQVPLTQSWLHGQQHEGEVWSVGLLVPF
jgi:Putative MetA-pathway of phenol degradation